jgi:cytochrome d ubiquinol oxidase subunit I
MTLDPVLLSRVQFSLTIMFHYIFPPLTIGLGRSSCSWNPCMATKDPRYRAAKFWTKIFAVNFALGVATGIVMEFQFGTNWATYSRFVGDVFGSALAAEGIFAFFLESGFLAVLVFGWDRVSDRLHYLATWMVALGSAFSAVWIVVANSWQQTPAGFHIVGEGAAARAEITDFWALVFNPSSMPRLAHVLVGSYILGGFFVMSISAYYILKGRHIEFARQSFVVGLVLASLFSLAAPLSGHFGAMVVAEHQPAKLAAFEGHFQTGEGGAPMHLWGIVDERAEAVKFGFAVPGLLSWLVHGNTTQPVPGLDSSAADAPVAVPFYSYHLMVVLGLYFMLICAVSWFFIARRSLPRHRWLLWVLVFSVLGPFAANQLGWIAAEVGRQPWVVYGLLRTSDAVSRALVPGQVLTSIVMFGIIYLLLLAVWLFVLNSKIQHGPEDEYREVEPGKTRRGWLDAAAALAAHGGESMTEAHAGAGPGTPPPRRAQGPNPAGREVVMVLFCSGSAFSACCSPDTPSSTGSISAWASSIRWSATTASGGSS